MAWLPDDEKILKICLFVLKEFKNVTDTDTQTPHDDIGRACIASRGKNDKIRVNILKMFAKHKCFQPLFQYV